MKQFVRSLLQRLKLITRNDVTISAGCNVCDTKLEGNNNIGTNTFLVNSELGKGSYIGSSCHFSRASIGRYCSIGSDVKMIVGTHPTQDWVSTHPAFFSCQKQAGFTYVDYSRFDEIKYSDESHNFYVTVGHDVWIGNGVSIIGGVSIGNGAIIAAGALVTKEVKPYTIVGGVPAKLIKQRFDQHEIQALLAVKWWDREDVWIKKHAHIFSDVKHFLRIINSDRAGE